MLFEREYHVLVNIEQNAKDKVGICTLVHKSLKIEDYVIGVNGRIIGVKVGSLKFSNLYPKSGAQNRMAREKFFQETESMYFRDVIKKGHYLTYVTTMGELALILRRRGPRMSERGSWNPNSRPKIRPTSDNRFSPSLNFLTRRPEMIMDLQLKKFSPRSKRCNKVYPTAADLSCSKNRSTTHSWLSVTTLARPFWSSARDWTWADSWANDITGDRRRRCWWL